MNHNTLANNEQAIDAAATPGGNGAAAKPIPEDAMTHGHVRRFILGLSVLWGTVQLVNAGVTLWLLLSQSLSTFVLVRTTLAYSRSTFAIAVTVWSFRRLARATAPVPALVPALVSA
jgi:hypothetical protein